MTDDLPVDLKDILAAHERIAASVIRTPLVESPVLSDRTGCRLLLKCENLQHVGAFKARGACNAVFLLDDAAAAAGVVAHSSGNHAAALARAAGLRGIRAHIVMPRDSAPIKIQAVRDLGVEPTFCEPSSEARHAACQGVIRQTGATLVHPYDDPCVIAGQGTVALEILEQAAAIDTLVVPVGGGGLLSGVLLAVKSLRPEIRVLAAEPEWADDTIRSLAAGSITPPTRYDSLADGLRTSVGQLTFPIIQKLVDGILPVSEDAIRTTTRSLFRDAHLVAEPSGAVSVAAVSQHAAMFAGQTVVAVISGGNLDLSQFDLATDEPAGANRGRPAS